MSYFNIIDVEVSVSCPGVRVGVCASWVWDKLIQTYKKNLASVGNYYLLLRICDFA